MRYLLQEVARRPLFVGVVHLLPTPGSPAFAGSLEALLERAASDACALCDGGVDALIVENFGDAPFLAEAVPPETVGAMAVALHEVRRVAGSVPIGVNVLRNDARAALGLCASREASFFRVNVHIGAMVSEQGILEGRSAETLRERVRLCPAAAIVADVHVKHATPLGGETLAEAAQETFERGRADVLVVSGPRTGSAPDDLALREVRERVHGAPLWVGSGLRPENARELLAWADGAIVGTALKKEGRVGEPVDRSRVERLRKAFDDCRTG